MSANTQDSAAQGAIHDLQIIDLAGGYSYTCGLGRVFKTDAELVRFVRQLPLQPSDATAQPSAGNWQQYAKEGESAQDVIERERKDSDALLTLLAKAMEAAQPIDLTDERAAFEKATNDARFFPAELDFTRGKSPSGRDEYVNAHLQSSWEGWQRRAALANTAQWKPADDAVLLCVACSEAIAAKPQPDQPAQEVDK